jgi:hypothetical protein
VNSNEFFTPWRAKANLLCFSRLPLGSRLENRPRRVDIGLFVTSRLPVIRPAPVHKFDFLSPQVMASIQISSPHGIAECVGRLQSVVSPEPTIRLAGHDSSATEVLGRIDDGRVFLRRRETYQRLVYIPRFEGELRATESGCQISGSIAWHPLRPLGFYHWMVPRKGKIALSFLSAPLVIAVTCLVVLIWAEDPLNTRLMMGLVCGGMLAVPVLLMSLFGVLLMPADPMTREEAEAFFTAFLCQTLDGEEVVDAEAR